MFFTLIDRTTRSLVSTEHRTGPLITPVIECPLPVPKWPKASLFYQTTGDETNQSREPFARYEGPAAPCLDGYLRQLLAPRIA